MAKFNYNNIKNINTGHILFELNYGYYPYISYKKDINSHSKWKLADKLWTELQKLILVY